MVADWSVIVTLGKLGKISVLSIMFLLAVHDTISINNTDRGITSWEKRFEATLLLTTY